VAHFRLTNAQRKQRQHLQEKEDKKISPESFDSEDLQSSSRKAGKGLGIVEGLFSSGENESSPGDRPRFLGGSENTFVCDDDEDGYFSDDDDTPYAPPVKKKQIDANASLGASLRNRIRTFFLSRSCLVISSLFGAMVCFFLVGMRVEAFLHGTGAMCDFGNTLEFDLTTTFWVQFAWLCLFVLSSSLILLLLTSMFWVGKGHPKLVIAAFVDIIVSSVCIALLFAAEAQRCCCNDEVGQTRLMAEAQDYCKQEKSASHNVRSCHSWGE